MKKRFTLSTLFAFTIMACVVTAVFTYLAAMNSMQDEINDNRRLRDELSQYLLVRDLIRNHAITEVTDSMLLDMSTAGLVSTLRDPWSRFYSRTEFHAFQNQRELFPLGFSVRRASDERGVVINEVFNGSPAAEAGMIATDYIVAINDIPFNRLNGHYNAVYFMLGQLRRTNELTITVQRVDEEMRTITLTPRNLVLPSVEATLLHEGTVGLIRLRNFNQGADVDFRATLDRMLLTDATAIIIDVRNNPGGMIEVFQNMLTQLLPGRPILQTTDGSGNYNMLPSGVGDGLDFDFEGADPIFPEGMRGMPVVILTNANTRGVAEFFAAAMHEMGEGYVVTMGEPTAGQGFNQQTFAFAGGSALVLSTQEFLTPSGFSVRDGGLPPEVHVSMDPHFSAQIPNISLANDPQLQAAIESFQNN